MTSIGRENLGTVLGTGAWRATLGISPNMVSNIIVQTTISTLLELPQFLMIQNVPYIFKSRSLFDLPNGWVVERKPCKNIDYAGIIDKHYHELETGKLFRSLRSVERDLTEGKKHIVTLEALKAEDHFIPFESSGSRKEHVSSKKVETAMLDPSSIPAKIKWVLGGPGGIVWNPFMDDHLVPGFIKQKCINTMAFALNGHRLIEDVLTDSWQHASGAAWKSRA
ncbi:hypothetical protein OIU78_007899 [Salix suchowensis]|nr:hypothetical protein OIU78_007899 [Salix suchowensis]